MYKFLFRQFLLLLSVLLLCKGFSQDFLLKTATDSVSLSGIASCKEISCISYSLKVVNNAIKNAKSLTDETLAERNDLQEKINGFNTEVAAFYLAVDSLGDAYAKNQKALESYAQERKSFTDNYRFLAMQPTLQSFPAAGSGSANRTGQSNLPSGNSVSGSANNMGNANTRMQKDIDEKALSEKGRRLNSEHRLIEDGRKTLERRRTRLLAEGNYLNEMLARNTDKLTAAHKRLAEVTAFGKKANLVLSDELKSDQKIDRDMLNETEVFANMVSNRIQSSQSLIINTLPKK